MAETLDGTLPPLREEEPHSHPHQDPGPTGPTDPTPAGSDARESIALARVRGQYSRASSYHRPGSSTTSGKPTTLLERLTYPISKFWRRQISITVAHESCRDHLAIERTFLGYLRTSLAFSVLGVTVAQLFRLQHNATPSLIFGFFVLGKPLACICQGAAIYTLVIGAFRTWRSQNAIARGKAISGGFEIILLALGVFAIVLMFFVLLIAVDVEKEYVTKNG